MWALANAMEIAGLVLVFIVALVVFWGLAEHKAAKPKSLPGTGAPRVLEHGKRERLPRKSSF